MSGLQENIFLNVSVTSTSNALAHFYKSHPTEEYDARTYRALMRFFKYVFMRMSSNDDQRCP